MKGKKGRSKRELGAFEEWAVLELVYEKGAEDEGKDEEEEEEEEGGYMESIRIMGRGLNSMEQEIPTQ